MDNCVTVKKAISALNTSTGVKWINWHGKHSVIKRCVVTLTPTTPINMNSPLHYFMPLGKAPMTDPGMFVKMYLKPRGNTMMFLPKLKFDFHDPFAPDLEYTYFDGDFFVVFTVTFLGQVLVGRRGGINTAAVSVNSLKSFGVGAEMALKHFKNSLIMKLDAKSKQLSIGYSNKNDLWTTTYEIHGNTITAKNMQQPIKIPMTKYYISGQIGFEISGTILAPIQTARSNLKKAEVWLTGHVPQPINTIVLLPLMKYGTKIYSIIAGDSGSASFLIGGA